MKKIVRLTESDLVRLVKRVINEQNLEPSSPRDSSYTRALHANIRSPYMKGGIINYQASKDLPINKEENQITLAKLMNESGALTQYGAQLLELLGGSPEGSQKRYKLKTSAPYIARPGEGQLGVQYRPRTDNDLIRAGFGTEITVNFNNFARV